MCQFPSWEIVNEKVYFLTDEEIEAKAWEFYDSIGHHAIENYYGVKGKHLEGWENLPKDFISAIVNGKCKKMMETGSVKSVEFLDKKRNKIIVIETNGTKFYYKEGKLHRDDGPAVIYTDGSEFYYKDGKRHRDDGPAVIWADGSEFYYKDDKLHRDDGPAVIRADGSEFYYKDDKLHRDDGPAVIWADGSEFYYKDGKQHQGI